MMKSQVLTNSTSVANTATVFTDVSGHTQADSSRMYAHGGVKVSTRGPLQSVARNTPAIPFLGRRWLAALKHLEVGALRVITPEGYVRQFQGKRSGPQAEIHLHQWRALWLFLFTGEVGLSKGYREGVWSSPCLRELFTLALENAKVFEGWQRGSGVARFMQRVGYFFQRNTLKGSKRNIQAHYDLSNDFYALWLDSTMTYSAALFDEDSASLEAAQKQKYDRLLSLLNCQQGHILEIGCGWGGFAERVLETTGLSVTGLTLSPAQLAYAQQRVSKERATLLLQDYRHQTGQFDGIVSIEMFEAVGEAYWPVYFDKIKNCLKPGGRAVIQTITIDEAHFERYRRGSDSIRSYIFPGGMLPSIERFRHEAQLAGLSLFELYTHGQGYAKTLAHWLERFEAEQEAVLALGFDEAFIRLWRYYLSTCYAGFKTGRINVIHAVLTHA